MSIRSHSASARIASCLAILLFSSTGLAQAEDEGQPPGDDLEDLMGGFDDEFESTPEPARDPEPRSWLPDEIDLSGSLSAGTVYSYLDHKVPHGDIAGRSTSYGNFTRLDLDGFLQLDVQLPAEWKLRGEVRAWYDFIYRIRGRGNYGGAVLDVYEWQVDSGEVYAMGPIASHIDLTVGRKIVNWGRSDTFRVVDVINPLDNKEPGLIDIEDLRRPTTMVKLDATSGPWSGQFLIIPESRYDRLPPPGHDFRPGGLPSLPIDGRSDFKGMPGLAGKIDGRFTGWDFSVYGAYVDQTSRVIDRGGPGPIPLRAEANRFGMLGAAGNFTRGPWLVKLEMAWLTEIRVLRFRPGSLFPSSDDKDRIDTMVGIEYYGPDSLTIALEIVNRHLLNESTRRGSREVTEQSRFETGLRISRPFFRERLNLSALAVALGERFQDGGLFRLFGDFELTDAWTIEAGLLIFAGGPDKGLGAFESNDRLYAELEYSF